MKKWFMEKYHTLRYYFLYYTMVKADQKKDNQQTQIVGPNSIGIQCKGNIIINGVVKPKDKQGTNSVGPQ